MRKLDIVFSKIKGIVGVSSYSLINNKGDIVVFKGLLVLNLPNTEFFLREPSQL